MLVFFSFLPLLCHLIPSPAITHPSLPSSRRSHLLLFPRHPPTQYHVHSCSPLSSTTRTIAHTPPDQTTNYFLTTKTRQEQRGKYTPRFLEVCVLLDNRAECSDEETTINCKKLTSYVINIDVLTQSSQRGRSQIQQPVLRQI